MNLKLEHIGIPVRDLERSRLLYCDLLGFVPFYETDRDLSYFSKFIFLEKDGMRIELQQMRGDEWKPHPPGRVQGLFHLSFAVQDLDKEVERWRAAGLKLVVAPMLPNLVIQSEEHWRRAVFEGPDEESIELRGP